MKKVTIKILTITTGVAIAAVAIPLVTYAAIKNTNKENNDILNTQLSKIDNLALTQKASEILPSKIDDNNINQYIVQPVIDSQNAKLTLTTIPNGADDTKGTLIVLVSIGWEGDTKSKEITISGFSEYVNTLNIDLNNATKLIQIKSAGAKILPSQINNGNINVYLVAPPNSDNGTIFTLLIPTTDAYDDTNGVLNVILKGTLNDHSNELSVPLKSYNEISFFNSSTILSDALTNIKTLTTKPEIATILPGQLTVANLSTYIDTPSTTHDGLITYNLSNPTNINNASKSIELTLIATLVINGQTTSQNKLITVTGFIDPATPLKNALDSVASLSPTTAGVLLTPSQITNQDQLNAAINIPAPTIDGLITYSLSLPSPIKYDEAAGTFDVILNANLNGVPSQSKTIIVSGFNRTNIILSEALATITSLNVNEAGAKVITPLVTITTLANYVATPANTTSGVAFTIALVADSGNVTNGTISITLNATIDGKSNHKVLVISGFLTGEKALTNYLDAFNNNIVANASGAALLTTQVITDLNTLSTHLTMPDLTNVSQNGLITNSFSNVTTPESGSFKVDINAHLDGIASAKKQITLTGFLSADVALTEALKNITSLNVTADAASIFASQISNDNIGTYINPPATSANGITYSIQITPNTANNTDGTINIAVHAKLFVNSTLTISLTKPDAITVGGFLKSSIVLKNALDSITTLTTKPEIATILPGQLTITNLSTYIDTPSTTHDGLITYNLSNPTNVNNASKSIELTLIATLVINGQTTSQNKLITVTGFIDPTTPLKNALDSVTSLSPTTAGALLTPSQITNQDQLNAAINIPASTIDGLITYSLSLPSPIKYDEAAGTFDVILNANLNGVASQSKTIIVSGFNRTNIILSEALATITSLNVNEAGAKVITPLVTITTLANYVATPANTTSGVAFTIALVADSGNVTNGTISITLTATIHGKSVHKDLVISGFLTGEKALTNYLDIFNSLAANESGAALLTTQAIKDISNLSTHLTMPSELANVNQQGLITNSFSDVTMPEAGSFKVDITAHLDGIASSKKQITLTGFLNADTALTEALNNITSLNVTSEAAGFLASKINNENINTYINTPAELANGITFSIQIVADTANNTDGTINVIVLAKSIANSSIAISQTKTDALTVSGFLRKSNAVRDALNNITNLITTSAISNITPAQVTLGNINTYIETPRTLDNGISFSLSNLVADNTSTPSSLQVTLSAKLEGFATETKIMRITGFLSYSNALANALATASPVVTELGKSTLPSVIAVNVNEATNYIQSIPAVFGGVITFRISVVSGSANDANGTLKLIITAFIQGNTTNWQTSTKEITLSGFKKQI